MMNKKMFVILSLIVAAVLLASCVTSAPPETFAMETSPAGTSTVPSPTESATPTAMASGTPTPTASATAAVLLREDTGITSPDDARDAYITGLSMRMDGQTDIIFDFVDWLSGADATTQYLIDFPGATATDMEDAGLNEIGYIRNVSHSTHIYQTGPGTQYFLPSADNTAVNVEVDYNAFRDRMFPAVEGGVDTYLTFVKISVDGNTLISVETLYLP